MPEKVLRLVLGDQLNIKHSWFTKKDENILYVMMELMQEQTYTKHHITKILCFFGAMREFAQELEKNGHRVIYIQIDHDEANKSFDENISTIIKKEKISAFQYQMPDEYRLDQQLKKFAKKLEIAVKVFDTEHFMMPRSGLEDFFKGKKQFVMENFYRYMREKFHLLMEGDEPETGKWNYDEENRKRYDGKAKLHRPKSSGHDLSKLRAIVEKLKIDYFGRTNEKEIDYPLNRKEALAHLDYFCKNLLAHFGTYEDAMLVEHTALFHSKISFALNTKMLSPLEVVTSAINYAKTNPEEVSFSQIEGFTRQIIGWREYMRGMYWMRMPEFKQENFFKNKERLPRWFWDGKTKMNCLKNCINNSLDNAYAHHIQRLMVIGNFALLLGCDPGEVDEWYLGVYIDAIEWVQLPNTRGMSQYADGGIIATKPYTSSAAYINKMSNYCKSCGYDQKARHGEKACPFNALYWDFFNINRDKLGKNHRLAMVYKNLERTDKAELRRISERAEFIRINVNEL